MPSGARYQELGISEVPSNKNSDGGRKCFLGLLGGWPEICVFARAMPHVLYFVHVMVERL